MQDVVKCVPAMVCVAPGRFQISGLYPNGPCRQNTASLGAIPEPQKAQVGVAGSEGKQRPVKEDRL